MCFGKNCDRSNSCILMTTDTLGGVWNYTVDLIKEFSSLNIQVALVSFGKKPNENQRNTVLNLNNVELFESTYKLEWMDDPWDDIEQAAQWLLDISEKVAPQIVHLNSFSFGSLFWQVPAVVVGHSCVYSWYNMVRKCNPPEEWLTYKKRITEGLMGADHVVAPSGAMLNSLKCNYGIPKESSVIYNGCDSRMFSVAPKEPYIFTAGRVWDDAKNISGLLKKAQFIEWPIMVAGDIGSKDIPEYSNVYLLGNLERSRVADFMSRASIYALPAFYEPFGLSILEAALSGCALVLGDIESLHEIWDGAAVFVNPQDCDEIADKIGYLINNVSLRMQLAANARGRALILSSQKMAQQYASLYKALATRSLHNLQSANKNRQMEM